MQLATMSATLNSGSEHFGGLIEKNQKTMRQNSTEHPIQAFVRNNMDRYSINDHTESIDDGLGPNMATLDSVAYMPSEPPTINVNRSINIARQRSILMGSASLPNLDQT
jgi:hypothetical protein